MRVGMSHVLILETVTFIFWMRSRAIVGEVTVLETSYIRGNTVLKNFTCLTFYWGEPWRDPFYVYCTVLRCVFGMTSGKTLILSQLQTWWFVMLQCRCKCNNSHLSHTLVMGQFKLAMWVMI